MKELGKKLTVILLSMSLSFPMVLGGGARPAQASGCLFYIAPAADAYEVAVELERLVRWGKKLAFLAEIITMITSLIDLIRGGIESVVGVILREASLFAAMEELRMQLKGKLAQAEIDAGATAAYNQAAAEYVGEHAPPANHYLCKRILLEQLPLLAGKFEKGVADLALRAIISMGRGPTDDAAGPAYAADEEALRIAARFANAAVDGYDATAADDTKIGPYKRGFTDADLTPFSMDGTVALELPAMGNETVTLADGKTLDVQVPNPENDNQRMWVAGLHYCFQLAGPRPTPPWGESADTPQGQTEQAKAYAGLSRLAEAVSPCTELLAYYTRPNSTFSAMIAAQKKSCLAAKKYIDDETFEKEFASCEKGLSPYQAELLNQLVCKSSQHYISMAQSNVSGIKLADETVKCTLSWDEWQYKVVEKQAGLAAVVESVAETREAWQ